MAPPTNLNLRQTIEGMTLVFNPQASEGLNATIQFDVNGAEPGLYHLRIADGNCTFHVGQAETSTLTISTPSEVWLKISQGELSGPEALMQGLYNAQGDLSLMLKMDSLFKSTNDLSVEAPPEQRPAGPIPLGGMTWMQVAFLPWTIYWITFDIPSVSKWVSVGLPLLLSLLIVGYRLRFNQPTWLEVGGVGFFTLAGLLALIGDAGFTVWGSVISSVVMACLWLGTLLSPQMPLADEPLSAAYSKWGYIKALWGHSMFIYPNAVITLMWGWQFIVGTLFGMAAILLPVWHLIFTLLRYLLLVPAFIFTIVYQKRAMELRITNYEATMDRLRFWASIGLSVASGLLLATTMPTFDTGLFGWLGVVPLLLAIRDLYYRHYHQHRQPKAISRHR